jgi:toxin ParE1/3/4
MRKLLVRPQARLDLLEIWHYIAADSIQNANRIGERLDAAIRDLPRMPGKGHARADVPNPSYRFWTVKPYVIAYRYDDATLIVMRVVHGHRNFRRLFKGK